MIELQASCGGGVSTHSVRPIDHGETEPLARFDSNADAGAVVAMQRGLTPCNAGLSGKTRRSVVMCRSLPPRWQVQ
jgi:hypothetical protein